MTSLWGSSSLNCSIWVRAKGLSEALLDSPVLPCCFLFCPYLHSLTLTFLLAPPPTQYEGSRLNEEVSEGEEWTVCSVFLFPSFLACERVGGFQMLGPPDLQSLFCWDKSPPTPPSPRSGLCVDVSVFDAMFSLCVGATVAAVLQSCRQISNTRCIRSPCADTSGHDASIWGEVQHSKRMLPPVELMCWKA